MRVTVLLFVLLVFGVGAVAAQDEEPTPTPAPTEAATPAPDTREIFEVNGVQVAMDHTITTGDVMVTFVLVILLFSLWGLGFVSNLGVVTHE